jgi:anti-anti-sigma regulatory factor
MSVVGISQVQGRVPITVFHLKDRINMGNVGEFEKAARQAYDQGMRDLLIDLTDVPSITSAGLRAILIIYRQVEGSHSPAAADSSVGSTHETDSTAAEQHRATHVKLLNPTPNVRHILEIAGLDRYLEIYVDLPKAIASF